MNQRDEGPASPPGTFLPPFSTCQRGRLTTPTPLVAPPPQLRRLLEQERFSSVVAYRKKKDHFMFTIESSGVLPPQELLEQALDILSEKARTLMEKL